MSKDICLATCSKRCTPLPPYTRRLSLETCFLNHNSGETRHGKRLRECEGGVREKKTKSLPKACLAREKTSSLKPLKWFLYIGCLKERMFFSGHSPINSDFTSSCFLLVYISILDVAFLSFLLPYSKHTKLDPKRCVAAATISGLFKPSKALRGGLSIPSHW